MVHSSRCDFAGSRWFDFAGDSSILMVQICQFQMAQFSLFQTGFDFAGLIRFCWFETVLFSWLVAIF